MVADTATVGLVACAGGEEIVLSGDGLDTCTLASAQRVGPFDLPAATPVDFTGGRLGKFEIPLAAAPLAISGLDLPPGTAVSLCDRAWEPEWLSVPEDSYVMIAGVKLTGRINFHCGKFEYGALFEETVLHGRRVPRGAEISYDDLFGPSSR